jgi:carbonic anhydrase
MAKLVEGVHRFRADYFNKNRELYRTLAERGQRPETLFITCSDSRVDPNRITDSAPGDLFIVRNVGNIVPQLALPGGTSAALEYAVEILEVSNIVVCGHTHCGAMQALLDPTRVEGLQYVQRWLSQTSRLREIVAERYGHLQGTARATAAAEENVLVQLENLREFPFVARRLEAGTLHLSGWVYRIESGDVLAFDPDAGQFASIAPPPPAPP